MNNKFKLNRNVNIINSFYFIIFYPLNIFKSFFRSKMGKSIIISTIYSKKNCTVTTFLKIQFDLDQNKFDINVYNINN